MALQAKTKLVNGERIDLNTNQPLTANAPITSEALTPQPNFTIPPTSNASPEAAGLQGYIGSQTDLFTQNLERQASQAEKDSTNSLEELVKSLAQPGEVAKTAELYAQKGGVNEIQVETTKLNNDLISEQRALENSLRQLEKEGGGLESGKIIEANRLRSESLQRQADISIILNAKQNQLGDAQAVATRSVAAYVETQRNIQNALNTIYENNRDLFNKAEQRAFEVKMSDRERVISEQRQNKTDIYNLAIEAAKAGASTSLMQSILSAKTPTEALANAGSIFGPKASAPSYQFVSATANQPAGVFNPKTGEFTAVDSGTTSTADTAKLQIVNDATSIMTSPAFNSTFGLNNTIQRLIPSTEAYYLAQKVNNFTSQLSLAARGELKGQGAVSDFEGKMLREAQTALTLNLSPVQATIELAKARGAIRTSSGLTTRVKITDPTSGQSQYVEAGQDGINQAIEDGLVVEYQ